MQNNWWAAGQLAVTLRNPNQFYRNDKTGSHPILFSTLSSLHLGISSFGVSPSLKLHSLDIPIEVSFWSSTFLLKTPRAFFASEKLFCDSRSAF